jgi:hypothetical protein
MIFGVTVKILTMLKRDTLSNDCLCEHTYSFVHIFIMLWNIYIFKIINLKIKYIYSNKSLYWTFAAMRRSDLVRRARMTDLDSIRIIARHLQIRKENNYFLCTLLFCICPIFMFRSDQVSR